MQPDEFHLIQGHKYSEEWWMLLDKDDHLQHHLRPEINLFHKGASAMQHSTDPLQTVTNIVQYSARHNLIQCRQQSMLQQQCRRCSLVFSPTPGVQILRGMMDAALR